MAAAIAAMVSMNPGTAQAEDHRFKNFGDFEQWIVRYIQESPIIGGQRKTIYAIGKTDTIRNNTPYVNPIQDNVWSVSNAYAKVVGIEKASGTVTPEKRGDGWCCRLEVRTEEVKVLGIINLTVMVTGTIFTGRTLEPVSNASRPYENIDFGIPFTSRPRAMVFDYKAQISEDSTFTVAKAGKKPRVVKGHDEAQAYMILQKRWEDENGNIYALRVGTGYEKFARTREEWANGYRMEVHYGDVTNTQYYRPYMALSTMFHAVNSKGKTVPVKEVGWASGEEKPTHAIIAFSSGSQEAFAGREGNILWIDNVKLEY